MRLFWSVILLFALAAILVAGMQMRDTASREVSSRAPQQYAFDTARPAIEPDTPDVGDETRLPEFDEELDADAQELVDDLLSSSEGELFPPMRDENDVRSPAAASDSPGSPDGPGDHEHQSLSEAENPWLEGDDAAPQRLQHKVEKQPDGSTLLDETFIIRGSGTRDDPYQITWDLLMSAAETYQPRIGLDDIPERIAMLDGKHVEIAGYLMFPMASGPADELLVMLNMWDGCCIGTMPSPYDAIEVQLGQPAPSDRRFMNYGSIVGKLTIDPYLINDWLIGLYVMEDARLKLGM